MRDAASPAYSAVLKSRELSAHHLIKKKVGNCREEGSYLVCVTKMKLSRLIGCVSATVGELTGGGSVKNKATPSSLFRHETRMVS